MKILLLAATPFEIEPCLEYIKTAMVTYGDLQFQKGDHGLDILITGVGSPATIFKLSQAINKVSYDLIINAGIAGSFDPKTPLGTVFQVVEDRFADLGIEERDGSFSDLFDMELADPNEAPFVKGRLYNATGDQFDFLPKASAITVNKVHGHPSSIQLIKEKYPVQLESMEGAGVFYCCQQLEVNCLQIRSVSNYVEPRNRDNWDIGLAIGNLNQVLIEMLSTFLNPVV